MKTILIAHNYSEVSFSAMSFHLANYLAAIGHRVIFISHQPYFKEEVVKTVGNGTLMVCSWPSEKRPTSLSDFYWYIKLHIKYNPQIIIGHFVGSNISIISSKVFTFGKVKTFEYYHTLRNQITRDSSKGSFKNKLLFIRKKFFYTYFCDVIVCPSEIANKDLISFFNSTKGMVVLNPMIDRLVSENKEVKDNIIISYLGRIDPSKGVLDLVRAFLAFKQKFTHSRIVLKIAGTGIEVESVLDLIKNKADISYLGGIDYAAVDDYLQDSHYTIIPSKIDNLPTVGLESMMNKVPLLISRTIGLSSYLSDGKECFKFNPTHLDMIALFEKVENNYNKQEQMAAHARQTFEEYFTIDSYCVNFKFLICNS
jgi:glycosyltransferase involved in cell wall biosynthesis